MQWIKLTDRMPNPDEHDRVLIYTEGCDFNGEQVFDVKAETLNECFYADPDDQPEVCRVASHWMPHPANTGAPNWTAEQKAADALRDLMNALPTGMQTSMTVFRPEVNGQKAVAAFSVLNHHESPECHFELKQALMAMGFCPRCEWRPCECECQYDD